MKKAFLIIFIGCLLSASVYAETLIKKPNVSGQFYSANPKRLSQDIDQYLQKADVKPWQQKINILISPHAGYVYSGGVAAYGFKAIQNQNYKTVIVIAPSHFYGFQGVSVWPEGVFETPLGQIEIDESIAKTLLAHNDQIKFIPQAFDREHSLEVQLPFLQKTLQNFKIVPIIMGAPNLNHCKMLAEALAFAIGQKDDVLVLISTDMSHYKNYKTAQEMDFKTLRVIENFEIDKLWKQCMTREMELCGVSGLATALIYAKKQGIDGIRILKYANSGDVTGDKRRVVGYSSIAFFKKKEPEGEMTNGKIAPLNEQQKKRLMEIAKTTIDNFVRTGKVPDFKEKDPRLLVNEGAFVTIHKKGQLRGCIGHIVGFKPLYLTVKEMAVAAATKDPRFTPLKEDELDDIDVEISVLSKPWRVTDISEVKAGVHGVIVKRGFQQGVFLPQVAPQFGWDEEELLSNLCLHKAGLPPDAWKDPKTLIEIFTAEVFSEKDLAE